MPFWIQRSLLDEISTASEEYREITMSTAAKGAHRLPSSLPFQPLDDLVARIKMLNSLKYSLNLTRPLRPGSGSSTIITVIQRHAKA
jgi:hypothetical protein